jgi:dihydropyrimidine dehydrogenase (NAD+) subunit PreA/dihydroorotate dehydrogenase (NAD+) catalytic subunit
MSADLSTTVAGLELKNPVIAGSSEATASAHQIRACLETGAAAVVAKSVNESAAAHANLRAAEYVLLDEELRERPLGPARRTDSLFCRSGLLDVDLQEWAATLAELDREAAERHAYVVPSLIVADLDHAVEAAATFERAGLRWLELNVGAPHATEAPEGIAAGVELVRRIRETVSLPLTVKLAAEDSVTEALAAGADAVCVATRAMGFVPDLETRRPVLGTFAAIGGAWALPLTLHRVAKTHAAHPGASIIATNGARDGYDVARLLLAGASAVALATAVLTDGPAVLSRAVEELTAYCEQHRTAVRELIGEAARHVQTYEEVAIERRH